MTGIDECHFRTARRGRSLSLSSWRRASSTRIRFQRSRVGLEMNQSTAFTLLHTLHQVGWVFRSPRELRYGLGSTLMVVGEAAAKVIPEVSFAPRLQRLASESIGSACSARSLATRSLCLIRRVLVISVEAQSGLDHGHQALSARHRFRGLARHSVPGAVVRTERCAEPGVP